MFEIGQDGLQGLGPADAGQRPQEIGPLGLAGLLQRGQDGIGPLLRIDDPVGCGGRRVLQGHDVLIG